MKKPDSKLRRVKIRDSREIRFVSMQVSDGVRFESLRFFDSEMDIIFEYSWDDEHGNGAVGVWQPPQEIPEGSRIIGIQADTFNTLRFRSFSFVLSPPLTER